jgi:hypothetical protein
MRDDRYIEPWPVWLSLVVLAAILIVPWLVIGAAVELLTGWPI